MNDLLQTEVLSVAQKVRKWACAHAARYNRDRSLSGYCAIASAKLHQYLTEVGINAELHLFDGAGSHVFVVVDDHIVDVTATQFPEFKETPIVIMHTKEAEQYYFYATVKTFKSSLRLRDHQIRTGWPKHQTVKILQQQA